MTSSPPTPALQITRLAKTFGTKRVLDLDGFTIERGTIHALLGQNGSGKSTMIKALSGFYEPDAGSQIVVGGVVVQPGAPAASRAAGCRFVHQDLGLVESMSVADNVYLGRQYPTSMATISTRTTRSLAEKALERAGLAKLDPRTLVSELSPAQRSGVAVARALAPDDRAEPHLLVLDEPTATLPALEVQHLLQTLRSIAETGVAILYVTHHLDEVFAVADDLTILRDGEVVASGRTQTFTHDDIVHHLIGGALEALHESLDRATDVDPGTSSHNAVFAVDSLAGERLNGVSLDVRPSEIVGVYGLDGSGRDTLLGTIFGARPRETGSVKVGGVDIASMTPAEAIRRGIGFVPANRKVDGALLKMSARQNLTMPAVAAFWRRGRMNSARESAETRGWFERLDVRPSDGVDLPLGSFSGGNQQKIILAKWLRLRPKVLLLDEPTQGVDVGAKAIIHQTILAAARDGAAIVISSSDEEELAALCSTVYIIERGQLVDRLVGGDLTERELSRRLNQDHSHLAAPVPRTKP